MKTNRIITILAIAISIVGIVTILHTIDIHLSRKSIKNDLEEMVLQDAYMAEEDGLSLQNREKMCDSIIVRIMLKRHTYI